MIRLVEIKNWRAYRDTAIDLSSRVVFFVAPNGVGKSSLVEAVRWCLLGQPAPRAAKDAVRLGADAALVAVELDFDGGAANLRVTRSITATGKVTLRPSLDGSPLSDVEYERLLTSRWSADLGLIDRLMFTDPQLPTTKSAFPVRDHLAATLGVTPLLEAAARLDVARKEISVVVADLRQQVDDAEAKVASFASSTSNAQAELNAITEQRSDVADELKRAEADMAVAERWDQFRKGAAEYNEAAAAILAELGTVIEIDPSSPNESLAAARAEATEALSLARQSKASQDITRARAAGASELLAEQIDICPTCLRPLSEQERLAALEAHGNNVDMASVLEADASAAEAVEGERVDRLTAFTARLGALRVPTPPDELDPGPEAGARLRLLRERDLALAEQAGGLRILAEANAASVALGETVVRTRLKLLQAAREEQLLISTGEVLNNLADKTLSDRIDPLIADLSHRWKLLFGTDGLTLEPSGELVIRSADGTLGITDLSGGERATAILIARLLIAAATTRIPAVWFDEPLEHLDPRRRAAVARTIVRAAQTGTVEQLFVTTYEERIARQLAAADPETVRVVHADRSRQA